MQIVHVMRRGSIIIERRSQRFCNRCVRWRNSMKTLTRFCKRVTICFSVFVGKMIAALDGTLQNAAQHSEIFCAKDALGKQGNLKPSSRRLRVALRCSRLFAYMNMYQEAKSCFEVVLITCSKALSSGAFKIMSRLMRLGCSEANVQQTTPKDAKHAFCFRYFSTYRPNRVHRE